ncbi:ABC transporter permease [Marinicrinis sediminis]|uniref:ABC transporter permease n=1 Tax=Marinicrinis sediminis TaxID=1652465 RepID=A0ABW5REX3_9BACL
MTKRLHTRSFSISVEYRKRMQHKWKAQWKFFTLLIDWVTALYLIVPAILFAGFQYVSWWQGLPGWMSAWTLGVLLPVSVMYTGAGALRLPLYPADEWMLSDHPRWLRGLISRVITYELGKNAVWLLGLVAGLAPIYGHLYGHGSTAVWNGVLWLLSLWLFRLVRQLGQHAIEGTWMGWTKRGLKGLYLLIISVCTGLITYVMSEANQQDQFALSLSFMMIVLAGLSVWLLRMRLRQTSWFTADLHRENRLAGQMYGIALGNITDSKPLIRLKRPVYMVFQKGWFRKRTPDHMAAELLVKHIARKFTHVITYGQFTGISMMAVFLSPIWIKVACWFVLPCLLGYWIILQFRQFKEETVLSLTSGLMPVEATSTALLTLIAPYQICLTLAVLGSLFLT